MAHQRGPDLPEPGELSAGARGQMHETWLEAYRQSWSICSRSETCTRPSDRSQSGVSKAAWWIFEGAMPLAMTGCPSGSWHRP